MTTTLQLAKRIYALSRERNDAALMVGAYRALAITHYFLDDFETTRRYAKRGVQTWRSGGAEPSVEEVYAPVVLCLCFESLSAWRLGKFAPCHAAMTKAISLAKEPGDTHALAHALCFSALLSYFERNVSEVEGLASEAIELSTRHDFAHWPALGAVLRGWARSASGDTAQGIAWIEDGIRHYQMIGSILMMPCWLVLKAEALYLAERTSEALEAITEAEADVRELREKLNRLLGLWGEDTNWKLSPGLRDVPKDEFSVRGLETLAVTQRYDLAAAKAKLESAIRAAGLEKAFRWVGALDFGVDSERDTDSQTITGPTLRLQLPIFNQGQARIARSQAVLRRAYDKFEQEAVDIRSEVRELRDRLISKRDIAQFYQNQLLSTRTQIRDQTQLQYSAMIVGPLELFTARRQEIAAERGYIEAKRDYWVTRAELERTVGGSLFRKPVLQEVSSKNPITKDK